MLAVYPCNVVSKQSNAGAIMNTLLNLLRKVLPKAIKNEVPPGYSCDTRLDTLYLVPTVEAATEGLLLRMIDSLARRFDNEKAS
jgi:hypothetical protein